MPTEIPLNAEARLIVHQGMVQYHLQRVTVAIWAGTIMLFVSTIVAGLMTGQVIGGLYRVADAVRMAHPS